MLVKIRTITKQKGQGIVEYALILAFAVGIAMLLNTTGIGSAVKGVFEDVADYLAYRNYDSFYGNLHNATNAELAAIDNSKRIKADQEGLQSLVQNLIGLSKEDALTELQKLMPNATLNDVKPGTNGDSNTFTIMSYWDHYDAGTPYITLGNDSQINAVNYVTGGQATTYGYKAADNTIKNDKTIAVDRFFYSQDMSGESSRKTITAQLHYGSDNKVESVNIVAHQGDQNGAAINSMNIKVTGSGWRGYSVN